MPGKKVDLESINKFIQEHAGTRHPRQIKVISALPLNQAGKVDRGKVLELFKEADQTRNSVLNILIHHVQSSSKRKNLKKAIDTESPILFEELELDSLSRMEILIGLETQHDIVITPDCCLLYTSPSPRDQRGSRMPSSA